MGRTVRPSFSGPGQKQVFLCCAEMYKGGRSGPQGRTVRPLTSFSGQELYGSGSSLVVKGGQSAHWVRMVRPSFSAYPETFASLSRVVFELRTVHP